MREGRDGVMLMGVVEALVVPRGRTIGLIRTAEARPVVAATPTMTYSTRLLTSAGGCRGVCGEIETAGSKGAAFLTLYFVQVIVAAQYHPLHLVEPRYQAIIIYCGPFQRRTTLDAPSGSSGQHKRKRRAQGVIRRVAALEAKQDRNLAAHSGRQILPGWVYCETRTQICLCSTSNTPKSSRSTTFIFQR